MYVCALEAKLVIGVEGSCRTTSHVSHHSSSPHSTQSTISRGRYMQGTGRWQVQCHTAGPPLLHGEGTLDMLLGMLPAGYITLFKLPMSPLRYMPTWPEQHPKCDAWDSGEIFLGMGRASDSVGDIDNEVRLTRTGNMASDIENVIRPCNWPVIFRVTCKSAPISCN